MKSISSIVIISSILAVIIFVIATQTPDKYMADSDDPQVTQLRAYMRALETRIAELEQEVLAAKQKTVVMDTHIDLPSNATQGRSAEPSFANDTERQRWAQTTLQSGSWRERSQAMRILAKHSSSDAVEAIKTLIKQADNDRQAVSLVLSGMHELAKAEGYSLEYELLQFYESGHPIVQRAAARLLEQQGNNSLTTRFIDQQIPDLQNGDTNKQGWALEALGSTRSPSAVPHILPMLKAADSMVRIKALHAIRRTGSQADIDAVRPLLNDEVAAVRDNAAHAIELLYIDIDKREGMPPAATLIN